MSDDLRARRVGVLMGGLSSEREVSLESGAGVLAGLLEKGYQAMPIDWAPGTSLPALLTDARIEIVWNALHGTYGEDGAVQGLLACMGIPYTGSGILASALAFDKVASKRIFESHGVPTAPWLVLDPDAPVDEAAAWALASASGKLVVKPAREGSSVGVTIVSDRADLPAAIAHARACGGPTLVERYLDGAELCVGILGGQVLGSLEIRPATAFYDYEAKYKRDDTQYLIPPPIPPASLRAVEAAALAAYHALGCASYARIDLRLDAAGAPHLLEANTLPGMTSHSLLPKIAAHAHLDYPTLCERILKGQDPGS